MNLDAYINDMAKSRQNPIASTNFKKNLGILVFVILISDLFIFYDFIFKDYIYVFKGWGYDTYHQYVPQLELLFQSFSDNNWGLMSFREGLGNDITSLQRWLTDPFTLVILIISLLIGKIEVIPELMFLLPIMVSLFAGVSIFYYLKRYAYSSISLIISSYMYALSGYLVTTGTHYLFTSFLVYFPLLLIAFDKIIYEKKYNFLVFSVFLTAFHGIYGAFAMYISGGIYFLFQLTYFSKKREFLKTLITTLMGAFIGILMSAIALLPNIYEMLIISNRISNESIIKKIFNSIEIISFSELKTALLRLISNNLEGGVDSWHGTQVWFCAYPYFFSILFIFLLAQWLYYINLKVSDKKGRIYKQVVTALFFLIILMNFIPALFNLFAYNQWRMIYVLLPFFSLMSMFTIDNIFNGYFSHKANIAVCALVFLIMHWFHDAGFIYNEAIYNTCLYFIGGFAALLTITNIKVIKFPSKNTIGWSLILILTMANYIIDHRTSIIADASPIKYSESADYYEDTFLQESIKLINEKEQDNFIRVDRTYLGLSSDTCWSYVFPARSVTIYNSLLNSNICNYMTKVVNYGTERGNGIEYVFAINDYGMYFDPSRTALLGLKYIVTNYPRNLSNWKLIKNQDNFYLYENVDINSAGLLYTKYITENEYNNLKNYQKAFAECHYVILENNTQNTLQKISPEQISYYDTGAINFDDVLLDNISSTEDNHVFEIYNNREGSLTLPVKLDALNSSERNILNLIVSSNQTNTIKICTVVGDSCYEEKLESYSIGTEPTNIVSIIPGDCSKIVIYFEKEICITRMNILASHNTFSNSVWLENKNMGNIVSGEIEASNDSILLTSIPYRKGWRAYIDGFEADCLKADYGFTAVIVPAGKHIITFNYKNPVLKYSIWISVIGCLLWSLYAFYLKKKH